MRKLSKNQLLTLSISLVSSLLLALTLYFSFLRVTNRLIGSVIDFFVGNDSISADVGLSNKGNQNLVVYRADMRWNHKLEDNEISSFLDTFDPISVQSPLVLAPGDIKTLSFSYQNTPTSLYKDALENEQCNSSEGRTIIVTLDLEILDRSGKTIRSNMVIGDFCLGPTSRLGSYSNNPNPFTLLGQ